MSANNFNPVSMMQRWKGASTAVVNAIQGASARSGVSFDYLMNKAQQESSFDPKAKAATSSATGLFQFIDSTWVGAVKTYGKQFGIGDLADKISSDGSIDDPKAKAQIMQLREDPNMAANMTAAMTKDNASYLETSLGGKVGESDLYMAHFLGLNGADKFLHARQDNPAQPAADLFPAAATANKNVFYDASGRKKSLDEVYQSFAKKIDPVGNGQAVTLVAARDPNTTTSPVISGTSSNSFSVLPSSATQNNSLTTGLTSGDRQLLESLLGGSNAFGAKSTTSSSAIGTNKLLSPYTTMIMAKLQTPDEHTSLSGADLTGSDAANSDKDHKSPWSNLHQSQQASQKLSAASFL
jgi:hypothetical protein